MGEHEEQKREELADGVGYAVEALISRAADFGAPISAGQVVQELLSRFPDAVESPAELAEVVIRAAAAKGIPVAVQKAE